MFLLPTSLIVSALKHPVESSLTFKMCAALSLGLMGTSVIFIVQCTKQKSLSVSRHLQLMPAAVTATVFRFIFNAGFLSSFISALISSTCYWHTLVTLLRKLPHSFTVGEVAVVSQAVVLFFYGAVLSFYSTIFQTPTTVSQISTIIVQVGLCAVATVILLTHRFKGLREIMSFYLTATSVLFIFIVVILTTILRQSPLLWIMEFLLFDDIGRTKMVMYMVICTIAAVLAVNYQISGKEKATPAIRKVFHIFAVAVYLPSLIYQCSLIYLASGVLLGIFAMLETIRILNIPPLGGPLQNGFFAYRDEKDSGPVALTPLYLLIGCSMPLWIHPAPCDVVDSAGFNLLPVMSGVLAIGIGDTAASVVGTKMGKRFWPGTKKTMEGTIGCIISQFIVVYALVCTGFLDANNHDLLKTVVAIIVGSLVEASTNQIDNIVLPLVLFIILC
ncbi:dolichol kinase isoform X2 [Photinus pyralis]|nr:dolichol kinase isoform X2 [Photinus pyralis]